MSSLSSDAQAVESAGAQAGTDQASVAAAQASLTALQTALSGDTTNAQAAITKYIGDLVAAGFDVTPPAPPTPPSQPTT